MSHVRTPLTCLLADDVKFHQQQVQLESEQLAAALGQQEPGPLYALEVADRHHGGQGQVEPQKT